MRRDTAVRRLTTIAEECQRIRGLWEDPDEQPFVTAAYAFGELIDGAAEVECVQVGFVLNLPAEELAWGAEPNGCGWLVDVLRLDKTPVDRYWRPAGSPVANHLITRPLRIWSADDGVDQQALQALSSGSCESLRLPALPPRAADEQLATDLATSLAHLRAVEASYWEQDWRRQHRGGGVYPESYLWDAVHGYLDLLAATTDENRPN
jgi:hypothetical protein